MPKSRFRKLCKAQSIMTMMIGLRLLFIVSRTTIVDCCCSWCLFQLPPQAGFAPVPGPVVGKPKHPQGHPGYLFPFHSCQKWLNSILIPYLLNTYTPEMRALARATRHRLDTSPAAVCFSRNLAL